MTERASKWANKWASKCTWVSDWANETVITWVCEWVIHYYWYNVFSLSVTVSVTAMCVVLCGSQRSAIRFYRTCCRSNWCNSLSLHTALGLAARCSDLCSLPSSPSRDARLFSGPALDLRHGWRGRRSSSQGRPSFHYLTPATVMGEFMQPSWHWQREFASFLPCSICKAVWWGAKVPNRIIVASGVSSFSLLSLLPGWKLHFFHPLWLADSKIYLPLKLFLKKILTSSHTETHTQTYSQTEQLCGRSQTAVFSRSWQIKGLFGVGFSPLLIKKGFMTFASLRLFLRAFLCRRLHPCDVAPRRFSSSPHKSVRLEGDPRFALQLWSVTSRSVILLLSTFGYTKSPTFGRCWVLTSIPALLLLLYTP